jgi:hypothetical protein
MGTRRQWAIDFAAALGNPKPNAATLSWISAWLAKENTKATFNPLATTYKLPPYSDFNPVGVKNYTTRNQGIEATVRTLRGAHQGYSGIIEGIVRNDPQKAADSLMVAPWGTNGAAVMLLWKTSDVGDGLLRSEPENVAETVRRSDGTKTPPETTPGNVPVHTPERIPLEGVNPLGPETEIESDFEGGLTGGLRTAYVLGGVFLVLIAGFLAIKTYVPVETVVKTVAAVAV